MANWTMTESAKGELTVRIEGLDWQKACKKAFNRIAKEIRIDGFRKGSVPKTILEKRVPRASVYEQAVSDNIQKWFRAALEETGIEPLAEAESEVTSIDESGVDLKFTIKVEPEAELGDLSAVKYEPKYEEVTEQDIDSEIETIRERYAEMEKVDRPAEEGDTVTIDYCGKKDGVEFEGGTSSDHKLVLGSHTFIPGFEEGLIGVSEGDEKNLELTFPEDYHSADLAGAAVVFEVKVKAVEKKVLPEVNDEFVEDQNIAGVDTVEQFRENVRERLSGIAKRNAESAAENDMMEEFAKAVIVTIPEEMISEEVEQQVQSRVYEMQQYGLSFSQYLQMMGMTPETFKESFREGAEKTQKVRLGLRALAKREGFTVSDEDLAKQYEEIAAMYGMPVDQVKQYVPEHTLRKDIAGQKAVEFLKGNKPE